MSDSRESRAVAGPVADGGAGGPGHYESLVAATAPRVRVAHEALVRNGYYVLRGVPLEGLSEEQCGALVLDLARCVSFPLPQNAKGDFVVRIEDEGQDYLDPKVRGHKTNAALAFHSDRTDLIFLLYVRKARQGGNLKLADVRRIYRGLQARAPDVAATLRGSFPNDGKPEQEGAQAWSLMPIFFGEDDAVFCRYIRRFIEESQRFPDAPRLTAQQTHALDVLDAELERPENHFVLEADVGDLLVIDNLRCLHARDAFEDGQGAGARRLAMRAWAAHANSPELPASFGSLYRDVRGGSIRGGFVHCTELRSMLGQPAVVASNALTLE